jgi:hypothetical protein
MPSLREVLNQVKLPFELAPLQVEDIYYAAAEDRFKWFLEVGCGKTVASTLTALCWGNDYHIVLCPPILLTAWEQWLSSIGETDVQIYAGPKRTESMLDSKWTIISWNIFRDSFITIQRKFSIRNFSLICDEAQELKNPRSRAFRNVQALVGNIHGLQLLTATPTSKPQDSYSYIKLTTPDIYRSFGVWEMLHVVDRDYLGRITAYRDLDRVAETLALKSRKRSKKEIFGHELPPIWQIIPYKLDPRHQKLYNQIAEEQIVELENGNKIDATTAQATYIKLQQIIVNWTKFSGNGKDRATIYDLIDQTIEEVNPLSKTSSKLVIWTHYVASSESVTAYLVEKFGKATVTAAYGKVNSSKAIDRIMHDPETRILVAQPSSCGVGLNLQHVCWEHLFIEVSTVPHRVKQAVGRTDRVGALNRSTVRLAQAEGTIQKRLMQQLVANDDLVSMVEQSAQNLRSDIFGFQVTSDGVLAQIDNSSEASGTDLFNEFKNNFRTEYLSLAKIEISADEFIITNENINIGNHIKGQIISICANNFEEHLINNPKEKFLIIIELTGANKEKNRLGELFSLNIEFRHLNTIINTFEEIDYFDFKNNNDVEFSFNIEKEEISFSIKN